MRGEHKHEDSSKFNPWCHRFFFVFVAKPLSLSGEELKKRKQNLEVGQKYMKLLAAHRIFNPLFSVWNCSGQTRSFVFDKLLINTPVLTHPQVKEDFGYKFSRCTSVSKNNYSRSARKGPTFSTLLTSHFGSYNVSRRRDFHKIF